jgi:hypothetical protein
MSKKDKLAAWLSTFWLEFDYIYMKPRFVHNWPQVKEDNDILAKRLKDKLEQYSHSKIIQ